MEHTAAPKANNRAGSLARWKDLLSAWTFNLPYVGYTLVFLVVPLVWAAWLSMTDWNLMSKNFQFVGFQNFRALFSDPKVLAAITNSYRYLVPLVLLCVAFGIGIALISSKLPEKFKGMAAVLFFIPYLTSGVATSVMVRYLFSYNSALNALLRNTFHLNVNWLQSKATFWILIAMVVWKMAGYYSLFILSAVESVPIDVYEAAAIDGCFGRQKFFKITLPMILPTITSVLVLSAGLAFQIYSEPFLLTGGGPGTATTTWLLEIYKASFTGSFKAGYGASMAILNAVQIFITIQVVTVIMNRINKRYGW